MTFAFYDLETTGLSPAFDQRLQFAAILMYGWLLLGKGSVNFWRLVGCGHVFGVIGAAWLPRAMMNSAWIWSQSMARAVKGRFGSNGVSASFCRQFAITSLCTLPFWSARVVDVDGPYCCSCVSRA